MGKKASRKVMGILSIFVILIGVAFVYLFNHRASNEESSSKKICGEGLYVEGKQVPAQLVFVTKEGQDFVELPLIATMEALGYPVTWIDDTRAEIIINKTTYVADLQTATLVKKENEGKPMSDFIVPIPGNPWGYTWARDGDIYVDQDIMEESLFRFLDIPASIDFDMEQRCVIIEKRDFR